MKVYNNFIGIDIGKFEVVIATTISKKSKAFKNTLEGFQDFLAMYQDILSESLVILETTGGYERLFLLELMKIDISTHRANTRQVKAFIRSLGIHGKTDGIDAYALAQYGLERHQRLALYQRQSVFLEDLQALAERRLDLNKSLVQEKNRSQAPTVTPWIQKSCQAVIKVLKDELECVLTAMNVLLETCPELAKRKEVLQSIAGIGEVISMQLIALLPELGYLNRRAIASLVGLAPHPNESGTKTGQRRTKGGRQHVRNILFMAGLSAVRSKSFIGAYYQGLIARGKKKMVALVAVMRKIIVIANARIKDALKLEGVVFDGSIGVSRP